MTIVKVDNCSLHSAKVSAVFTEMIIELLRMFSVVNYLQKQLEQDIIFVLSRALPISPIILLRKFA